MWWELNEKQNSEGVFSASRLAAATRTRTRTTVSSVLFEVWLLLELHRTSAVKNHHAGHISQGAAGGGGGRSYSGVDNHIYDTWRNYYIITHVLFFLA